MGRFQQGLRNCSSTPPGGDPLGLEYHYVPPRGSMGGTGLASFEGMARALTPKGTPNMRRSPCSCLLLPVPRQPTLVQNSSPAQEQGGLPSQQKR